MASGDLDLAAAAEIVLADVSWHEGDLDRSAMHQRQAAELVAGTPTSKAKAFVVANLSRFLMLAGESAEAIRVGREALAMAEQLNLDDLRAHTLNNIGSARIRLGDLDGIGDLEESIAIAEVADPVEATRSYGNLASTLAERGDIRVTQELNGNALVIVERPRPGRRHPLVPAAPNSSRVLERPLGRRHPGCGRADRRGRSRLIVLPRRLVAHAPWTDPSGTGA